MGDRAEFRTRRAGQVFGGLVLIVFALWFGGHSLRAGNPDGSGATLRNLVLAAVVLGIGLVGVAKGRQRAPTVLIGRDGISDSRQKGLSFAWSDVERIEEVAPWGRRGLKLVLRATGPGDRPREAVIWSAGLRGGIDGLKGTEVLRDIGGLKRAVESLAPGVPRGW